MATTLAEQRASDNKRIEAEKVEAFFKRLDNLHDHFEAQAGEFKSDCKELYAEAAEALGSSRKVFKHAYQTHRSKIKLAKREAEFEDSERNDLDLIRAALGDYADTPLGRAATS
jgi:hypothetical protein